MFLLSFRQLHNIPFRCARSCLYKQALSIYLPLAVVQIVLGVGGEDLEGMKGFFLGGAGFGQHQNDLTRVTPVMGVGYRSC